MTSLCQTSCQTRTMKKTRLPPEVDSIPTLLLSGDFHEETGGTVAVLPAEVSHRTRPWFHPPTRTMRGCVVSHLVIDAATELRCASAG